MSDFYTSETFDSEKYKKTGWTVVLRELEMDNYKLRLIVRVATGRKYWPLFSEIVDLNLGKEDPAILYIKTSLQNYTFPMIDRFVEELEIMLSDLYQIQILLK